LKIVSKQAYELIKVLSINHLKIKYKRTTLGFAWSMLNPLLFISALSIIFSTLMNMPYLEFVLMFFPAFLAWGFFSSSVNAASMSIISNESLLRKTPIHTMIFPLVSVVINFIEFILTFSIFLLLAIAIGYDITIHVLILPFSIIILLIFTIGFSLIVSVISTYFRDFIYLVGILLQLWFYLSPIIYSKEFILGKSSLIDIIMSMNPMVYIIDLFRTPISQNQFVPSEILIISSVISFATLLIGVIIFNNHRYKLVHRI
jgi:ABC-type polysaccharide/polyol phosphate export permease